MTDIVYSQTERWREGFLHKQIYIYSDSNYYLPKQEYIFSTIHYTCVCNI